MTTGPSFARHRVALLAAVVIAAITALGARESSGPAQKAPARPPAAALWVAPSTVRDLFHGIGGQRLSPDPEALYTVIEIKTGGFSDGYTVVDEKKKREWSVKLPPEGATEVVASRLVWGLGYHQPPIYLLDRWRASGAKEPNPQRPARFREKDPAFHGLKATGVWAYDDNPFVGTLPLNGLLVLQAMLGNSDLKDDNNALYELDRPVEGAGRWYVARDLGQTFGRTGLMDPPRGDVDVFEKTPFITAVKGDQVDLEYHGRHQQLFEHITVADVRWICRRLAQLTDRQWRDAFRAGGYDQATADRFIRRFKAKIAEGLALPQAKASRP